MFQNLAGSKSESESKPAVSVMAILLPRTEYCNNRIGISYNGEIVVDLAAYVILLWDINICCDKGAWRKSIRYLKLINKRYNKIVK
jgi:hypothetical protein